ncbi:MAG: hypothetical protein HZA35_00855 [Parcubacteria group bacterium]|nr:hypothetical protein [Parcubacteria group bacterium]
MAYKARKTEHSGPKKGRGAYWGRKQIAKKESNKKRREDGKKIVLDVGGGYDDGLE